MSERLGFALKFVDAHIHLTEREYDARIGEVVAIARQAGLIAMVTNSTDLRTSKLSLELAEKYPGLVYAAAGIHPWNANQLPPSELQEIVDFISLNGTLRKRVIAIGEIGLDPKYAKRKEQKEQQLIVFIEMVRLAEQLSLPIIVHSRWSAEKILTVLSSYRLRGVLWHWFSGSSNAMSRIVERGDYVSEGPPVAYSDRIQEIVSNVPLERLLTETDGPVHYYGPFKDTLTTPALIPQTVKAISRVRNIDEPQVAEQILSNFANFFSIRP